LGGKKSSTTAHMRPVREGKSQTTHKARGKERFISYVAFIGRGDLAGC